MSGSGISWTVCKSAPRSRQITTPVPHHSVFYRPDALPAAQPTASKHCIINYWYNTIYDMKAWLTHTHTRLATLFPGLPGWADTTKGKANLDFTEARDSEWQWHQPGCMQVCTSLQTDNHASTPLLSFLQAFLTPNQQRQSTEGYMKAWRWRQINSAHSCYKISPAGYH